MNREEELNRTARFVREWAIQKAKAERRTVTEVVKEMKEEMEQRKLAREKLKDLKE
jgi:DNA polymerase IIIc chi subunit